MTRVDQLVLGVIAFACACGGSVAAPLQPSQVREQVATCRADSGACQLSTACKGAVEGRICDASECITADAAVRIAIANGLPGGLDAPRATFVYDRDFRRLTWFVRNRRYDSSRPDSPPGRGGGRGGDLYIVDAVTGELLGKQGWGAVH